MPSRREGSGFCVFNDIAIAIAKLRSRGIIQRAAVVDLDVHQGDGTAHIFQDEPKVLTLSVHCKNNFPLRKQRSTIDVELEAHVGDESYLEVLRDVLPQVQRFEPEIIFFQSGVDGLESDVLGKLSLTLQGLKSRDRMVMELAQRLSAGLVVTMGGGYSSPIELTALAHANTFRQAAEIFTGRLHPSRAGRAGTRAMIFPPTLWRFEISSLEQLQKWPAAAFENQ